MAATGLLFVPPRMRRQVNSMVYWCEHDKVYRINIDTDIPRVSYVPVRREVRFSLPLWASVTPETLLFWWDASHDVGYPLRVVTQQVCQEGIACRAAWNGIGLNFSAMSQSWTFSSGVSLAVQQCCLTCRSPEGH